MVSAPPRPLVTMQLERGLITTPQIQAVLDSFEAFMDYVAPTSGVRVSGIPQLGELVTWTCGDPCRYDHLLRLEHLQEDLTAALIANHLPPVSLRMMNPSSHSAWSSYYTCDLARRVEKMDARVFEQFGYEKLNMVC